MKLRRSSGGGDSATALERVAIVLASLVLSIGLIAALSGFFAGHDPAGVSGSSEGPGKLFPDQGHVHLAPGDLRPEYDSQPPTSGPHVPDPVLRDNVKLSDDQLLQALELGDVVIMYGGRAPPPGLTALARSVAAPFSAALAAAGQAVIIAPNPPIKGLIGLAWRRMVRVATLRDPLLQAFAQSWLGQGASRGQ